MYDPSPSAEYESWILVEPIEHLRLQEQAAANISAIVVRTAAAPADAVGVELEHADRLVAVRVLAAEADVAELRARERAREQ